MALITEFRTISRWINSCKNDQQLSNVESFVINKNYSERVKYSLLVKIYNFRVMLIGE